MNNENDPWHEAKKWLEQCRTTTDMATKRQIAYVDHLSSEIDRLTKRVAELEAEPEFTPAVLKRADEIVLGDVVLQGGAIRTVTQVDLEPNQRIIRYDDLRGWHKNDHLIAVLRQPLVEAKTLADMQPPFEGPTERIEPILDPDRLMATARWFLNNSYKDTHEIIAYLIACHCGDSREAKPYKLKGGGDE